MKNSKAENILGFAKKNAVMYRKLLLGVNIGGTGTLIASLASLITFREYVKHTPQKKQDIT